MSLFGYSSCLCPCHNVIFNLPYTCSCLCNKSNGNIAYQNNNDKLINNLNLQIKELEEKIKKTEKWSRYAYKDIIKRLDSLEKLNICKVCNGEKFIPLNIGSDIYKIKCVNCS